MAEQRRQTGAAVSHGQSYPLGPTVYPDGVNFCVFSRNCDTIELWLFDAVEDEEPSSVFSFDPEINRTFYYWHIFIQGIEPGQLYGYKVYGPYEPGNGFFFDGGKLLLDPYGKGVAVPQGFSRIAASRPGDNTHAAMKSVVVDLEDYDWEGDEHPRHEYSNTVIYELHIGGFTKHPSSGAGEKAGTYAGLVEKIPYLNELGVTAVELLPVQQFDEKDGPRGLKNYWGYTPVSLFAPHTGYSADRSPLGPVKEFKDMVKVLHRNGIEVILDVVFNHSAEAGASGPTYSWKGFEAKAYYMMSPTDNKFQDYTGCGNTFNANHSIIRRMIIDCLHYWVADMHVDGFRFDLASVLSRDELGQPMVSPPLLWSIDSDPILADTKIIAEAWDAAGLYQLGSFVGHRWAEWNGKFRDDIRRFMKGDSGMVESLASKIAGSPDLFTAHANRDPNRSINFITCHDGFSLNDLVSYNDKHNLANRENDRDGNSANFSWNCGVEGETKKPEIEKLRRQQIKNFFALLLVSQGTPMISMGDEVRRTQNGNNNAYCQDNEISWFDWNLIEQNKEILGFVQKLLKFHHAQPHFQETVSWINPKDNPDRITWHGVTLNQPDWSHDSRSLAFTLNRKAEQQSIHVMINSYREALDFQIPSIPKASQRTWHRLLDTSLEPPHDISSPTQEVAIKMHSYSAQANSIVILIAKSVQGLNGALA